MNPVRGIETHIRTGGLMGIGSFKLMNPVRGIETSLAGALPQLSSFKLMNPVRGIETASKEILIMKLIDFQINESRSRDWNKKYLD